MKMAFIKTSSGIESQASINMALIANKVANLVKNLLVIFVRQKNLKLLQHVERGLPWLGKKWKLYHRDLKWYCRKLEDAGFIKSVSICSRTVLAHVITTTVLELTGSVLDIFEVSYWAHFIASNDIMFLSWHGKLTCLITVFHPLSWFAWCRNLHFSLKKNQNWLVLFWKLKKIDLAIPRTR